MQRRWRSGGFKRAGAPDDWLEAPGPPGTDWRKPCLTDAAWRVVMFAQRWRVRADGSRLRHSSLPESVGIALRFLIPALNAAGLATVTHMPNPTEFLREVLGRPESGKAVTIVVAGPAAEDASVLRTAKKGLGR